MAVVDPELRVADAAIMLTVVSGNTHAATIMIGERGADLVPEKLRLAARLFPQGALCKTVTSHYQPAGSEAR